MAARSLRSGKPPKVAAQPFDDDSDVYVQSDHDSDDGSDHDVQPLDEESDDDIFTAGKSARKPPAPHQPTGKRATQKDKSSTARDAQQQQDDSDDYEPAPGVSTIHPSHLSRKRPAGKAINPEARSRVEHIIDAWFNRPKRMRAGST